MIEENYIASIVIRKYKVVKGGNISEISLIVIIRVDKYHVIVVIGVDNYDLVIAVIPDQERLR